jgi:DNA repair protein RecO (recombination protein O)
MSEIIKTEALVLNKINYGDTSVIAAFYTKEFGRLSGILKGGRNAKSQTGPAVNPLNHIEIVMYKKDTREVQLISGASIITHYPNITADFEKIQYAYAVIELLKKLTPEHETNYRLFSGTIKILSLLETSNVEPIVLFGRYFLFFLLEMGYELQFEKCVSCGKSKFNNESLAYNFDLGILCGQCSPENPYSFSFEMELFNYLLCLKYNKPADKFSKSVKEQTIGFLEQFTKHHIPDFKGLQSVQLLK